MPRLANAAACGAFVTVLLSASLAAQAPAGHFVVAGGQTLPPLNAWTGQPGIFVGHPRTAGTMLEVQGLPAALTSQLPNTPGSGYYGTSSVAVHHPSGDLLVGTIPNGTSSNPVELYRVYVDPQTLVATVVGTYLLGSTVGLDGDVNQIAVIDANRVLVSCNHVSGAVGPGPMCIAEVDLATGAITPWPLVGFPAYSLQAICVDAANGLAYVGGGSNFTNPSTIYSVPIAAMGPLTPIATVPVFLDNLQFDRGSGTIVAGGRSSSPSNGAIFRIDPSATPATVTTLLPNWQNAPSIAVEPSTGDILFGGVQANGSASVGIWHLATGSTTPTFLSNTVASGVAGLPMGIAVMPAPRYYGSASAVAPATVTVPWHHEHLAGGLPLVGNQSFALELDVPAGATLLAGLVGFGDAALLGTVPGLGLDLLVDVASPGFGLVTLGGSAVPVPIPNSATVQGLTLCLQAMTLTDVPNTGVVLGASDGAVVTVL